VKEHVALVGFMAAGKSTIGRHLAHELGLPFVDTDELIEARHGPIHTIFARDGEPAFRSYELAVVRDAFAGPRAVISLGGGALTHEPTRALVAERAVRVYLEVPVASLVARLRRARTVRPAMGASPTPERVRALLALREPHYREAELTIHGARRSKRALAGEIAERLRLLSAGVPA
jgi:shikimate kinase